MMHAWKKLALGVAAMALSSAAWGQFATTVPKGNYNVSKRSKADMALPAPYLRDEAFFKFPAGRPVGSTSAIDIDPDGKSIWIVERCGTLNNCIGSQVNPVMEFDSTGKVQRQFGKGLFVYPHGMFVDRDGNVWATDLQTNFNRPFVMGTNNRMPDAPKGTKPAGAVVMKFSHDGKLLMTLGTPGVSGNDASHFSQPSDVLVARNGDIFVADGHDTQPSNHRIVKFDKTGKFIKAWDACGTATNLPLSKIDCTHSLAMDSQGRLFVANRGNSRISIFDQDGKWLADWTQFGKPSGLYIDKNDTLYAADSESDVTEGNAFIRGIHIGSAKTGQVTGFLPDTWQNPSPQMPGPITSGPEGVVVGADGTMYSSEVLPMALLRYVKK